MWCRLTKAMTQSQHDIQKPSPGLAISPEQAVFSAATDELYGRLVELFLAGSLLPLALHPSANFVVQAALSCVRSGDQVQWQTLQPCLLKLAILCSGNNVQSSW